MVARKEVMGSESQGSTDTLSQAQRRIDEQTMNDRVRLSPLTNGSTSHETLQASSSARSKSQGRMDLLPPLQIDALSSSDQSATRRPVSPLPGGLAALVHNGHHASSDHSLNSAIGSPVRETPQLNLVHDPKTGSRYLNQYLILGELGRGVHGKVKLARDTASQQIVAIKIVDRESKRRKLARRPEKESLASKISPLDRDGSMSLRSDHGSSDSPKKSFLSSNEDKIRREIAIFKKCQHEHVVGLLEVIDDPSSKKIFMVLEYMAGGEIRWKAPKQSGLAEEPALSVEEARRIFRDVASGLRYLHYQGIIHRDIKPANLLHTGAPDFTVKISDFGVSHLSHAIERAQRRVDEDTGPGRISPGSIDSKDQEKAKNIAMLRDDYELAKTAGSPAFFAPELCFPVDLSPSVDGSHEKWDRVAEHSRPPITKAIDVWALGVTLYCILFAKCPFMADTEYELFNKIPSEQVNFPNWMGKERMPTRKGVDGATVDVDVIDLLTRLLEKDPFKRITLHDAMRHPWVLRGLEAPSTWLGEAEACQLDKPIEVTHEEVHHGLTMRDRVVNRIAKIKTRFKEFGRRRGKSLSESDDGSKKNAQEAAGPRHASNGTVRHSEALMPPPPLPSLHRRPEPKENSESDAGMTADEGMSALGDTDADTHYWQSRRPSDPLLAGGYRASSFSSNGSSALSGLRSSSVAGMPRSGTVTATSISNDSSPFLEGQDTIDSKLQSKSGSTIPAHSKRRTIFSMGAEKRQGARSRTISNEGSIAEIASLDGDPSLVDKAFEKRLSRSGSEASQSSHEDEGDEDDVGSGYDGHGYYDDGGISGPGYIYGDGNDFSAAQLPIDDQHVSRAFSDDEGSERGRPSTITSLGEIIHSPQSTSDTSANDLTELGAKEMSDMALEIRQRLE